MSLINQISGVPVDGGDLIFKNYGGSDIPSNTGVLLDGTNLGTAADPPGVVVPTASGGVAKTIGVTLETIKAGGQGRVRVLGGAVCVANAAISPGDLVQIEDAATFMGRVKVATSTNHILGKALSSAVQNGSVLVFVCPVAHN
jgi:hypothetical protein